MVLWSNFSAPVILNSFSSVSEEIVISLPAFCLPKKYISKGRVISKTILILRFIVEKIVFDCEITPIVSAKKCPSSAILIGADPDIPPCHTISPEYPAAPING